jgi:hypothetical protein
MNKKELELLNSVLFEAGIEMTPAEIEKAVKGDFSDEDEKEDEEEGETEGEEVEDEDKEMDFKSLKKAYASLQKSYNDLKASKKVEKGELADIQKSVSYQLSDLADIVKGLKDELSALKNETPAPKAFGINHSAVIEKAIQNGITENGVTSFSQSLHKSVLESKLLDAYKETTDVELQKSIYASIGNLANKGEITPRVRAYLLAEKKIQITE